MSDVSPVWIPGEFDPRGHKYGEHAAVLLNHLQYKTKKYQKKHRRKKVEIHSKYLQDILGTHKYKDILEAILDIGVIQRHNHYVPRLAARQYDIPDKYYFPKWTRYTLQNKTLRRRLLNGAIKAEEQAKSSRVYDVAQCLKPYLFELSINIPEHIYNNLIGPLQIQIDDIRNQSIFCRPCRYNRIHSNITNLSSEFRPYLNYRDSKLSGVDIKASQPTLICMILHILYSLKNFPLISSSLQELLPSSFACYALHYDMRFEVGTDVLFLKELIEQGLFYEFLQEAAGLSSITRSDFKDIYLFACLYGKNYNKDPVYNAIRRHFPSLAKFMNVMKRKDPAEFPRDMQRFESHIMMNTIMRRLINENPTTPFFGIHDSILSTQGNESLISNVIEDEFRKYGINVGYSVQTYS